ncbi:MFS transporter [bacterium]|nr:MFS transporter [bacterium]
MKDPPTNDAAPKTELSPEQLNATQALLEAEARAEAESAGAEADAALQAALEEERLLRSGQAGEADKRPRIDWSVLSVVLVGTLLGPLGGMIVGIAQPSIARDFNIDLQTVKWMTLIFWVVTTFLVPVTGYLGRRFGEARMFIAGMAVDGLGTLLCSLVPSGEFGLLLACRCIQGLGSALMFALFGALITRIVPPQRRGMAFGMAGATVALSVTLAPLIGGLLLSSIGWRGIFWVQLPLHLLGFIGGLRKLPRDPIGAPMPFPWLSVGAWLLLTSAGVLVSEAFSKGLLIQYVGWLISAAVLAGAVFAFSEARGRRLFNYALFRIPIIRMGSIAFLMSNIVLFAMLLLLPFYFTDFLGYSEARMGLILGLSPLLTLIIAPLSGHLSDRLGFRLPIVAGLCLSCLGYALLAWGVSLPIAGPGHANIVVISIAMALLGLSSGIYQSPLTSAMMGAAGDSLRPQASSLASLMRNLGFMSGTSLGALALGLFLHHFGGREMMLAARSEQIGKAVPLGIFQHSLSGVFWVCCVLLALGLTASLRFPNRLPPAPELQAH